MRVVKGRGMNMHEFKSVRMVARTSASVVNVGSREL